MKIHSGEKPNSVNMNLKLKSAINNLPACYQPTTFIIVLQPVDLYFPRPNCRNCRYCHLTKFVTFCFTHSETLKHLIICFDKLINRHNTHHNIFIDPSKKHKQQCQVFFFIRKIVMIMMMMITLMVILIASIE